MNGPQISTMLLTTAVIAAVSVITALPATPLASETLRSSGQAIGQASEAREPYPENKLEAAEDGDNYVLAFKFFDKFGNKDSKFSCSLNKLAEKSAREQQGLNVCQAQSGGTASTSACYDYYRDKKYPINWRGVKGKDHEVHMKAHGMRLNGKNWALDYDYLIRQARPLLEDCSNKIRDLGGGNQALMDFVLSIHYKALEDIDCASQKWTLGFRVPTSVMLMNEGDCDTKAALYCSLFRGTQHELVIFRSVHLDDPAEEAKGGHAMVGIDTDEESSKYGKRRPDNQKISHIDFGKKYSEEYLKFGVREYIPVDATGPGMLSYGEVAKEKAGTYEAIPISISLSKQ